MNDSPSNKSMPPEVRQWLIDNLEAFFLTGFDYQGNVVELTHAGNPRNRFALYESLRQTVEANSKMWCRECG